MPTCLITGANRGLGLEFARQYAEAEWTVIAGVRDPDKAGDLAAIDGDVAVAPLDVADAASVGILAERLRGVGIDLLINNAGVGGPYDPIGDTDFAAWQHVMDTNLYGAMRVTEGFLGHLRAGSGRKIATISSGLASIGDNTGGRALAYRTSKAAVNMAMRTVAMDLAGEGFTVVLLVPGWVRTDMGGASARLSPEESVGQMKRVLDGLGPADNGRFIDRDGTDFPW
ncbi:MAG: SDR family oxidoreductase [Azospirillaceae bacterium]